MEHKVDDAIKATDRKRVRGYLLEETARAQGSGGLPGGGVPDTRDKKDEKTKAQFGAEKVGEADVSGSGLIDLVTLAEEADEPELDLLGNGFLRRGGGMHIIGPTECGKSSLSVQMAVEWACAYQKAIIKACGALRILVVQAEDDRQDSREMARVYRKLALSEEQIELVKKNTRFVEWCPKGIERKGESAKEDFSESGAELTTFLDQEIKRGGPVDVVIVNPLSAYMDEGIMSQKANRGFFYGWITPFLRRQACAIVFVHHTPKFRDDGREQHHYVQLYAGAGDATITNWPRASMFVRPTREEGFFEFVTGKRGRRMDWKEEKRLFKWSEDGSIHWQEVTGAEKVDFYSSVKSKGGRNPSISAMCLERVMRLFKEEWVIYGDVIHALMEEGFSESAARRAIHKDEGSLRKNLAYSGNKKKTKIKWNGFTSEPSA